MNDYKKFADIVGETETHYIATVWTGLNYYIGCFEKSAICDYVELAHNNDDPIDTSAAIARTSVLKMTFMCKDEDFSKELLQDWINFYKDN